MSLAAFEEPQTFGPKGIFLGVWIGTLVLGVAGVVIALVSDAPLWFWILAIVIGVRQLWVTRWVQVDREGVRTRNIFGRGRSLPWEGISDLQEKTFPLRREKFFAIIKVIGTSDLRPGETTIEIDSDTDGYDLLRGMIVESFEIQRGEVKRQEEDIRRGL